MRDDYTEQATSDISAPSFHINARYILLNDQRMPDIADIFAFSINRAHCSYLVLIC